MSKTILTTLCIIHQENKVLLGLKKRGLGKNKWNGFGGKLESGESIEQATMREAKEESGLDIINLNKLGILTFCSAESDELECHVFKSTKFTGTITESDEMKPQWFLVNNIPFGQMWPDDKYWVPLLLQNKKFIGNFHFDDSENITKYSLNEVSEI